MSKILFLVSSMGGGGAERVAALLSNQWVDDGHSVILMPTFSGGGECAYPLDERIHLDFLADRVGNKKSSFFNKIKRFITLRKAIKEINPDVIISFLSHVNIAAIITSLGLKIPVVVSERSYPPAMPLGYFFEKLRAVTYPYAKAVVVQTEKSIDWLSCVNPSAVGIAIPNPVVFPIPPTPNSVSPALFDNSQRKILLAVGRLSEEKGFDILINTFKLLAVEFLDWDLIILGEGPMRASLENEIQDLGLQKRIYLPGNVGNIGEWYECADLYVMSSSFEGFPNTLIEAMAYGLPAVSFDCDTGPRDIIRNGIDGYLVEPVTKEQGLSSCLKKIMSDDILRLSMGCKAVEVKERFSVERILKVWNQVVFN